MNARFIGLAVAALATLLAGCGSASASGPAAASGGSPDCATATAAIPAVPPGTIDDAKLVRYNLGLIGKQGDALWPYTGKVMESLDMLQVDYAFHDAVASARDLGNYQRAVSRLRAFCSA